MAQSMILFRMLHFGKKPSTVGIRLVAEYFVQICWEYIARCVIKLVEFLDKVACKATLNNHVILVLVWVARVLAGS